MQSGVPIVPVIASNQRYALYETGDAPHWRGGTVLVQALPAIETKGKTADDVDALIEQTRSTMLAALIKLNAEARKLNGIDSD